ncbi:hypothetical protein T12_7613 [Trichinella patagoniensis]|uniref:Peptidase aspartic putative domain-containing protein n=1 Tax=Trichinella patagoniensis TaxID=990121 RepID=A0A0V1AGP2_9BILA|nr:hypothetical protein T12_7613 [Trichinella patagoniensis]
MIRKTEGNRQDTISVLHMLQPEHRATECRLKNRGWGLHHLLVLMSSNQQAQRQAEPDDHVPPLKQVSHRSKKGNNLPCIAHQHTRFSQNPVSNSEGHCTWCKWEATARALGLVGEAETVTVKGIGGIHCTPTLARKVGFRLSPLKVNEHDLDVEPIEALTLARICDDIQSVPVRCGDWNHLQHLRNPTEQDEKLLVHVLIGVDSYG